MIISIVSFISEKKQLAVSYDCNVIRTYRTPSAIYLRSLSSDIGSILQFSLIQLLMYVWDVWDVWDVGCVWDEGEVSELIWASRYCAVGIFHDYEYDTFTIHKRYLRYRI